MTNTGQHKYLNFFSMGYNKYTVWFEIDNIFLIVFFYIVHLSHTSFPNLIQTYCNGINEV